MSNCRSPKNDKWAAFKPPFHWLLGGEDLYISGRGYIYLLKIQLKPVPKSNAILGGGRATHSKHPLLIFGKFPQEGTKLTKKHFFNSSKHETNRRDPHGRRCGQRFGQQIAAQESSAMKRWYLNWVNLLPHQHSPPQKQGFNSRPD